MESFDIGYGHVEPGDGGFADGTPPTFELPSVRNPRDTTSALDYPPTATESILKEAAMHSTIRLPSQPHPPPNLWAFDSCVLYSVTYRLARKGVYPEALLHTASSPGGIAWTRADFEARVHAAGVPTSEVGHLWRIFSADRPDAHPFRVAVLGFGGNDLVGVWQRIKVKDERVAVPVDMSFATLGELRAFSAQYLPGAPDPTGWLAAAGRFQGIKREEFLRGISIEPEERDACPLKRLRGCVAACRLPLKVLPPRAFWTAADLAESLGISTAAGLALVELLNSGYRRSQTSGAAVAAWGKEGLPGQILLGGIRLQTLEPERHRLFDRKFPVNVKDVKDVLAEIQQAVRVKQTIPISQRAILTAIETFLSWKPGNFSPGHLVGFWTAVVEEYMGLCKKAKESGSNPEWNPFSSPWVAFSLEDRDLWGFCGVLTPKQRAFALQQYKEINQVVSEEDKRGLLDIVAEAIPPLEPGSFSVSQLVVDLIGAKLGFEYSTAEQGILRVYLDPQGWDRFALDDLAGILGVEWVRNEVAGLSTVILDGGSKELMPVAVPHKLEEQDPKKTDSPVHPSPPHSAVRDPAVPDPTLPEPFLPDPSLPDPSLPIPSTPIPPPSHNLHSLLLHLLDRQRFASPDEHFLLRIIADSLGIPSLDSLPVSLSAEQFRKSLVISGLISDSPSELEREEFDAVAKLIQAGPGAIDLQLWRRCTEWRGVENWLMRKEWQVPAENAFDPREFLSNLCDANDAKIILELLADSELFPSIGLIQTPEFLKHLIDRLSGAPAWLDPRPLGLRVSVALVTRFESRPAEDAVRAVVDRAFELFDRDGSGKIDLVELKGFLAAVGYAGKTDDKSVTRAFQVGSGPVAFNHTEFSNAVLPFALSAADWLSFQHELKSGFYDSVAETWKFGQGSFSDALLQGESLRDFQIRVEDLVRGTLEGSADVAEELVDQEMDSTNVSLILPGKASHSHAPDSTLGFKLRYSRPFESDLLAFIAWASNQEGALKTTSPPRPFDPNAHGIRAQLLRPSYDESGLIITDPVWRVYTLNAAAAQAAAGAIGASAGVHIIQHEIESAVRPESAVDAGCCGSPRKLAAARAIAAAGANNRPQAAPVYEPGSSREIRHALAREQISGNAPLQRAELERMAQFRIVEVMNIPEPAGVLDRAVRLGFTLGGKWVGAVWEESVGSGWKMPAPPHLAMIPRFGRARADVEFLIEFLISVPKVNPGVKTTFGAREWVCTAILSLGQQEFFALSGDRELRLKRPDGGDFAARSGSKFLGGVKAALGMSKPFSAPSVHLRISRPPNATFFEGLLMPDVPLTIALHLLALVNRIRFAMAAAAGDRRKRKGGPLLIWAADPETAELRDTVGSLLEDRFQRDTFLQELNTLSNKDPDLAPTQALVIAGRRARMLTCIVARPPLKPTQPGPKPKSADEANMKWLTEQGFFDPEIVLRPIEKIQFRSPDDYAKLP